MITKLDYLKKCVVNRTPLENKDWYIKAICIPTLIEEDIDSNPYQYKLVTKPDGLYYLEVSDLDKKYEVIKIQDYKHNLPLFTFKDIIEIDGSWLPSVSEKISTRLGNLIVNTIVLYASLGTKIQYINTTVKLEEIESIFIYKVKNDISKDSEFITVDEMIDCIDRFYFLTNLAFITNIASSEKVITGPTGIDSKRKELLKEYEGQLDDPVKLVELEKKLEAFDREYLEGDEAASVISTKKKGKTARKKMYLIYGNTLSFDKSNKDTVITSSLNEGIDITDNNYEKYINDSRYGSYARGASTAMSGYSYKVLQRSLSSVKISDIPCDTTKGLLRLIDEKNHKNLVNRYIKSGNSWVLIDLETTSKTYIGKVVEIRSVMYCKTKGNSVCYKCLGETYKGKEAGVTNIAANISAAAMTAFLKLMHGVSTDVINLEDNDLIS